MTLMNERQLYAWNRWFAEMHGVSVITFVSPLWLCAGASLEESMQEWLKDAPSQLRRVELWSQCTHVQLLHNFLIRHVWRDQLSGDARIKYAYVRAVDMGWNLQAEDARMISGPGVEISACEC